MWVNAVFFGSLVFAEAALTSLATNCFIEDVEFAGNDVKPPHGTIKDAAGCQELCQANPQCYFFTYKSDSLECFEKNNSADNRMAECKGCISGPRACEDISSCVRKNLKYVGDNLLTTPALSPERCYEDCKLWKTCKVWSFTPGYDIDIPGLCYLKSSFKKQIKNPKYVSGPKICESAKESYPSKKCLYNQALKGDDLETYTSVISTPETCQLLCKRNKYCHFWSHENDTKSCHIKRWNANGTAFAQQGFISGEKECELTGKNITNDEEKGHFKNDKNCIMDSGFDGIPIDRMTIGSVFECRNYCREHKKCDLWNFSENDNICDLFIDDSNINIIELPGVRSGDLSCTINSSKTDLNNINILQGVNDIFLNNNKKNQNSDYTSFERLESVCELMEDGNIHCSNNEQTQNCEMNIYYNGYNIPDGSLSVASPQICQEICRRRHNCRFWSHDTIRNVCYLKSKKAKRHGKYLMAMISGNQYCTIHRMTVEKSKNIYNSSGNESMTKAPPSPSNDPEKCKTGWGYVGIIEHATTVATARSCQSLCKRLSVCRIWSFNRQSSNCQFFEFTSGKYTRNPNAFSGSGNCVWS